MEQDLTELVIRLVFQLAVILVAAKVAGEVCTRYLKVPPVLGELVAGIIIGPYALGGLHLGPVGPLFEASRSASNPLSAISPELWSMAQVAAVVLLFVAGLETDIRLFMRYVGPATAVAVGGVILPFFFGAFATAWFGFGKGFGSHEALFMGAAMTATSVGITARVLSDLRRISSPEGVTVLAAAVVDDVLGILVLTIVAAIAATGSVSLGQVGVVFIKAVVFWVLLTGGGLLLSRYISRFVLGFRVGGGSLAVALALAFLAAALAESVGLAMIIGAYSIGLALSGTPLAQRLREPLEGVYNALVPIFFVVMGMLVDISAMRGAIVFGLVISGLAIIGKVVGCGLPALGSGFNMRGSWRVGLGMLPRGEVALIVAGVGLAEGMIGSDLFGVTIMMTVITTLLAPILLVWAFRKGGPGLRRGRMEPEEALAVQAGDEEG